ncbi:hypothetical protein [Nostoc sp.]|uniref:hypothetical protein n=1 Tax=Nostoc sp. TaxID=1180 RepID=UPI002FF7FA9A
MIKISYRSGVGLRTPKNSSDHSRFAVNRGNIRFSPTSVMRSHSVLDNICDAIAL